MNWIILSAILLVLSIVGIVYHIITKMNDMDYHEWVLYVSVPLMTVCVAMLLALSLIVTFKIPAAINNYSQQKEYVETHESENAIEDAALTSKKIELNEWLYEARFMKTKFRGWSLYPDEVLELEPIQ